MLKSGMLIAMSVYTYLRLIVDHGTPNLLPLRQKEVDFCISMLREKVRGESERVEKSIQGGGVRCISPPEVTGKSVCVCSSWSVRSSAETWFVCCRTSLESQRWSCCGKNCCTTRKSSVPSSLVNCTTHSLLFSSKLHHPQSSVQ